MATLREYRSSGNAGRGGYTLLELVLVCSLLVLLASLTAPSLSGMLAGARVDAAGDMILARMADARSMAMEQGKTFRFGFVPGTGRFQIAADDSSVWNSAGSAGTHIDQEDQLANELPEGVVFTADPNSQVPASGSWQTGGVFLSDGTARGGINPDGTTIDDVTFYYGLSGATTMHGVRLRGMTGTVRLFDPTDPEASHP